MAIKKKLKTARGKIPIAQPASISQRRLRKSIGIVPAVKVEDEFIHYSKLGSGLIFLHSHRQVVCTKCKKIVCDPAAHLQREHLVADVSPEFFAGLDPDLNWRPDASSCANAALPEIPIEVGFRCSGCGACWTKEERAARPRRCFCGRDKVRTVQLQRLHSTRGSGYLFPVRESKYMKLDADYTTQDCPLEWTRKALTDEWNFKEIPADKAKPIVLQCRVAQMTAAYFQRELQEAEQQLREEQAKLQNSRNVFFSKVERLREASREIQPVARI